MNNVPLAVLPLELFSSAIVAPCGSENVHPCGVTVYQDGHLVEVGAAGAQLRPTASTARRGSLIVVRFFDENNHAFEVNLQFHKGATYIGRTTCVPLFSPPVGLWRD